MVHDGRAGLDIVEIRSARLFESWFVDMTVTPRADELPPLFGGNIDPTWDPVGGATVRTKLVEALGLDFVTIQDHPYQSAFYDTWTLLSYLAAQSNRLMLIPTVASLPLRPPAVLAKSAATLDLLTGGRVRLGLGAGAFWDAIVAMGGPRRTPKQAVDALTEAIDVIRAMWSGQRSARTDGEYYSLGGTHPGPTPGPNLGIWLGAYGPRTLRLTGTVADGWMPSLSHLSMDRLPEALSRIDEAAREAGRNPRDIRKVYNINGIIGTESSQPFQGSTNQWIDQLTALFASYGMNAVSYWPDGDYFRQMPIFAEEIVPAVREALGGRHLT